MLDIIVIADTSCLISLTKIRAIHFLKELYHDIFITEEIASEFGEPLPDWIKVQSAKNKNYQKMLFIQLDKGEASAIALAFELKNVLLILDDLKGRKEAEKLGFKITGTLGVLIKAKKTGLIKELKPYIETLLASGFRVSQNIIDEILLKCNEN